MWGSCGASRDCVQLLGSAKGPRAAHVGLPSLRLRFFPGDNIINAFLRKDIYLCPIGRGLMFQRKKVRIPYEH